MILTVSSPGGGGGVGPCPLVADLEPRHPILGLQIALGVAGRQTPGPREADHHDHIRIHHAQKQQGGEKTCYMR